MADAILQRYDAQECHFADPKELVEMMVFDGCFIIEVIIKYWMGKTREYLPPLDIDFVESDLILFENQIPFFVLEELFRITVVPSSRPKVEAESSSKTWHCFTSLEEQQNKYRKATTGQSIISCICYIYRFACRLKCRRP
uniref:Uncharacterized protein n=1 Tax=Ananas comosus var. bracteatus TaxID=296719 RepID=A0A6V7PD77_ANACO|nr:unnamed protein product [Ananas comosus var. bracteatus]